MTLRPLHRASAHFKLSVKQAVKDLVRAMFPKQGSAKACQGFRETLKKASAFRIVGFIILATYFYRNVKLYEVILNNGIYILNSMKIDNSSTERVEQFKYLGTTLTNKNSIQEEIKSRLKVGNTLL